MGVQLNIFLAILIEGYTVVKSGAAHSQGLPAELLGVVRHELRRAGQVGGAGGG